jgi:predicted ATPase
MAGVIGRERELAAVEEFLEDSNAPGILIVQGEPGIGKTTVWSSGVAAAAERGYRVLSARPAQVETTMSFSAVRDLLQPILGEVSPGLPDPQRRALEIALLLAEPGEVPPDPGVISYAFASALRAAATSGRLLVAVDDIQWLDRPSATALTYVLRRLGEYPVGFLLAQRVGEPDQTETDLGQALPEDRVDCVNLGPLTLGAIQRLLGERLGQRLSRPTLHRVYTSSGGNPFYALEIARALERRGRPVAPGEPLPVPDTLAEIVNERLAALPTATERALQAAALISNPTVEVVASVLEEEPALATAVNAHVIEIEGDEIVFSHPLLASGLASRIKSSALRSLHGRIAAAISDPEERARHLALAAEGPDEEAAAVIEVAAE